MLRRTILIHALAASFAGLGGWLTRPATYSAAQPAGNAGRSHGKGKGRLGARKTCHAPRHTQRNYGKPARRRRRAAALRRG